MARVTVCDACFDAPQARFLEGDATWHDGAGWYYVDGEYADEGSCGVFPTREAAVAHARQAGYYVGDNPCEHMR
jgi:hypothetical protein